MEPLRDDDPRSLGGFRILARLAVGGMGRVYLALGADRRAVALKVARAEFAADARFRVRFRREVETGRGVGRRRGIDALGGSWIAPVVAADPDAELPWLASEYVPGPSVTEALMGFGPLTAAGLRTLTYKLALALAEVHAAGVVHRDVKPSNVLLARDGPRLIDFGVARALDDVQLTRVGAVIGSPGFLSPEQAVGKPATFGSDVFSMASVVAYAACGVGPFGAGDGPALLYRVVHEAPRLVNVPQELARVLAACLAKDPGDRPSAVEVTGWVTADPDWLPASVLEDIARREAELAAWIEVAGAPDPAWDRAVATVRAQADFEAVAEAALELANAGADVDLATPPAEAVFGTPRTPTTHRRAARRRHRFPVYAALGALVGAAATAAFLLLPHGGHHDPQPYHGPMLPPTSATSSAASATTRRTASPALSGEESGPRRTAATSASGSPR